MGLGYLTPMEDIEKAFMIVHSITKVLPLYLALIPINTAVAAAGSAPFMLKTQSHHKGHGMIPLSIVIWQCVKPVLIL